MRFLLDSHVLHDVLFAPSRLSARAQATIIDPSNDVLVSAISPYELELKSAIGKLSLPAVGDWANLIRQAGFELLDIVVAHGVAAARLPLHHRDPWDRMLVAQALHEGLVLVTTDRDIAQYGVATLW